MTDKNPPPLSQAQRRHLRGLGHNLRPVVTVAGAGLSENVLAELEQALDHHELIKVSVRTGDRHERDALIADMCERTGARLVQRVGNMALVFRPSERRRIALPKATSG